VAAQSLSIGEHDTDLERPGRCRLSRQYQRRRGLAELVGEELGDLICDRSIESATNLMSSMKSVANHIPELRSYSSVGRSLTRVARNGAGRAVDVQEVGAEDGGEGQRV